MNTSPDAPNPLPPPETPLVPGTVPAALAGLALRPLDAHVPDPEAQLPATDEDLAEEDEDADWDDDQAEDSERLVTTELADWKDALRQDFETWLATLDNIPEAGAQAGDDANDAPDLYSFYAQFAAAGAESRKGNRRTAEAMSQWGETLARFESGLQPLREAVAQLTAAQPKSGRMTRAHCLVLVELLDRMHRLARAFQTTPAVPTVPAAPPVKRSWFGGHHASGDTGAVALAAADEAWRGAWNTQRQALDILVSHLEGWLAKEGVTRQLAAGQPFDPAFMMAVAAEPDATRPAQTVLEELAAGYVRDGELLRAAQVKVSRRP